jgi:hypothetical protein
VNQLEILIFACAENFVRIDLRPPFARSRDRLPAWTIRTLRIEAKEMRSRAPAKRPAFTEERVPCGAVSAPSGNSMQWLCFRGARTHRRTSREFRVSIEEDAMW